MEQCNFDKLLAVKQRTTSAKIGEHGDSSRLSSGRYPDRNPKGM